MVVNSDYQLILTNFNYNRITRIMFTGLSRTPRYSLLLLVMCTRSKCNNGNKLFSFQNKKMSKRSRLCSSDLVDESSPTDKDIIRTKEMEIDEKNEEIKRLKSRIESKDWEKNFLNFLTERKVVSQSDEIDSPKNRIVKPRKALDKKEEVDNQKLESELDILAEKNKEVEYFKEQMEVFKKAEELTAKKLGEEMAELKLKWSRYEAAQNAEIKGLMNRCREQQKEINQLGNALEKQELDNDKELTKLRKDLDEKEVMKSELKMKVGKQKKEMEDLTKKIELHDGFVAKLKNQIECPVCLGVPSEAPVFSCPNGHMICNRCKCKMDTCPTCKEAMGQDKSLLAVTILENIDHECSIDGCEETLSFEDLGNHVRDCEHRVVRCPFAGCDETMPLMDLMKHLNDSKKCCMFIKDCEENGSGFTHLVYVNNFFKDRIWKIGIFKYQGVAFAIKMDHANGNLNVSLLMFKSEPKCAKYKLEIIAHCADSTPQDASFSYICRGAPGSVDQEWDRLKQVRLTVSDEAMRTILKKKNNHDQFKISFNII